MKKRNSFTFLVKVKYTCSFPWEELPDIVKYEIRTFERVKKPLDQEDIDKSYENLGWRSPSVRLDDALTMYDQDEVFEAQTGDEYIEQINPRQDEYRFNSRNRAIIRAAVLGLDLYEFKKGAIPHPLTFKTIRKFARRVGS